ncbi:hypothetical protein [Flavobacterium sp. SORGH_AS_0622]|uniref:ORC-CDC6 family AAA ATPase n=1 Tax=Flavobacterium sp. SORGH_AS_0622 TaxID=3041772 RepID=UPI0027877F14|nr:hypothetical protein [Flavobacterium sp. SORGH_AS_0622]MDQ1166302.1 DNA polymerase III delta prime subunit [Flavobacterium sp. SORGH_AS_0622]
MENSFIEQAEYLPKEDFITLSSSHPREDFILTKLMQSGAKLLTGPRGCGKTTLILKAYNKLLSDKVGAFGIYVNFKTSLKLEPIYKSNSNGSFWFTYWMYLKIYEGLYRSIIDHNKDKIDLTIKEEDIKSILFHLELGEISKLTSTQTDLSFYALEQDIDKTLRVLKKNRCIILFDDAAHAFSIEQQKDFFELFRKIKSRYISPKAAIYPGVTSFSPTFNVGHDAEEVNAWIDPENEKYLDFMGELLQKRLPQEVFKELEENISLLYAICYASFGIPRQLLNIVRNLYSQNDDSSITTSIDRKTIFKQIRDSYKSTLNVFISLEKKIPTYVNYIEEGKNVFEKIIGLLKEYNKNKAVERKSITVAIKQRTHPDLKKILGFFQYAGLVSYKGQLSKGEKGVFDLYLINIGALLDFNAILATKSINLNDLKIALSVRNAHEYTRTQSEYLLSKGLDSIKLNLPACQNCKSERINENARFCHNCGASLITPSNYENLINEPIESLSLTLKRVKSIKSNSNIRKVKDILFDIGGTELLEVPQIGKYWANKIYYIAEEFIS